MKIANRVGEVACRLVKTSDRNLPMAIRSGGDMDVHRVIGQQIRYFLGPFNETIRTRVEIILIAQIKSFLFRLDALKIKVIQWSVSADEIGRSHVRSPDTNEKLV